MNNNILGVFVAKGDVGIGTIVGSAVFNVLVIIGLCALLCDKVTVQKLPDHYHTNTKTAKHMLFYITF